MEIAEHIESIRRDGTMLAAAARQAGLDERVPSCPDWDVRELVRHQGYVHRWATAYLAQQREDYMEDGDADAAVGPIPDDDEKLVEWFTDGHRALVETLTTATDDVVAFTFLPAPTARAFWARRQAHETAIHRVDAELAAGSVTPFAPDHAADGIDELLCGFGPRSRKVACDPPRTLAVRCNDAKEQWRVRLGSEGLTVEDPDGSADCSVSGSASDLYLLLWNRGTVGGIEISGDGELLDYWKNTLRVRWG